MKDGTVIPTKPGVYVDRVVNDTHDIPGYIHTLRVGDDLADVASKVGVRVDEIRTAWFETSHERLVVIE